MGQGDAEHSRALLPKSYHNDESEEQEASHVCATPPDSYTTTTYFYVSMATNLSFQQVLCGDMILYRVIVCSY